MDKNEEIVHSIKMNKGTVYDDNMNMYCDKHKHIFTEMDNTYRCMS